MCPRVRRLPLSFTLSVKKARQMSVSLLKTIPVVLDAQTSRQRQPESEQMDGELGHAAGTADWAFPMRI